MPTLDPALFGQIRSICEHAGKLVQMGEDEFAISKYYEALSLVPDPKSAHKISTFIYTALGEEYWRTKEYSEAGKCFMKAYKCPEGDTIGRISLRLGQCLEESGERKLAQDYLCQAFLLDGEAQFKSENPKYYRIIRSEVEGTDPEEDELEFLRDDDEYDIIDNILKESRKKTRNEDYTGYSGAAADRSIDLYSRSGQSQRGRAKPVDSSASEPDELERPLTERQLSGYKLKGNDYFGLGKSAEEPFDDEDDELPFEPKPRFNSRRARAESEDYDIPEDIEDEKVGKSGGTGSAFVQKVKEVFGKIASGLKRFSDMFK